MNSGLAVGYYQQKTISAFRKNKVYITLVQKANILFSLSSHEVVRLESLSLVRSMDVIMKNKNKH